MTSRAVRADRDEQHDLDCSETVAPAFLLRRAEEMEETPVLIDGQSGRTATYEKLAVDVERIATTLADCGFEAGDVLAVSGLGLAEYVVTSYAVTMLGGTSILTTPRATTKELIEQADDADAPYLVTVPPFLKPAMAAADATNVEEVLVFGDAVNQTEYENGVTVTPLC